MTRARAVLEKADLTQAPDIAFFQESFHPEECVNVTPEAKPGFVCEDWQPGDPTVQMLLGADHQIACNLGKPDKCVAVKSPSARSWAAPVTSASTASTAPRSPAAEAHASVAASFSSRAMARSSRSGITQPDQDCRVLQFAQVFDDLGTGDGPAANGERNVIANTDPGRITDSTRAHPHSPPTWAEHRSISCPHVRRTTSITS